MKNVQSFISNYLKEWSVCHTQGTSSSSIFIYQASPVVFRMKYCCNKTIMLSYWREIFGFWQFCLSARQMRAPICFIVSNQHYRLITSSNIRIRRRIDCRFLWWGWFFSSFKIKRLMAQNILYSVRLPRRRLTGLGDRQRLDLLDINNQYYRPHSHHAIYVSEWKLNVHQPGVVNFFVAVKLNELWPKTTHFQDVWYLRPILVEVRMREFI